MGQGLMGSAISARLHAQGFSVAGWARLPRRSTHWPVYSGPAEFGEFLARSDILINNLPLTSETTGILSASTFERLPAGASLLHLGRGAHLDEQALLRACNTGHLRQVVLDATAVEPLPAEHPFWEHPSVIITPHVGAQAPPEAVVRVFVENLQRSRQGTHLINVVSRVTGY